MASPSNRFSFDDPLRSWVANNANLAVESPVEALFDYALTLMTGACPRDYFHVVRQSPIRLPGGGEGRADFRVSLHDVAVYVEIDGWPWHERTPEQGQRDRARDRLLVEQGQTVVRFMGAEVHANPFVCASETMGILRSMAEAADRG